MIEAFTGLVPDLNPTWRSSVIQLPPMAAGDLVSETLYNSPPTFIHSEDQRQTNSCSGHGGSTACEVVLYDGSSQPIQLSRWGLYICGQSRCGMLYRDAGATLSGVHDALKMDGIAEESLWPFTGSYDIRIPQGAMENAALRKVTHSIDVESGGYDSVRTVIGQNIGAVVMACRWPLQVVNGRDVAAYNPQGNGGHCMSFVALSTRKDEQGRPWVWCANSHAGNNWLHWSPNAVDACLKRREWGAFGITMMSSPKPRKPAWAGRDNPFEE